MSHTPADIARQLQVKTDQVYHLIAAGELKAVNVAQSRAGRPRWRILDEDLQAFLRSRQNVQPTPAQRRRRKRVAVRQYF